MSQWSNFKKKGKYSSSKQEKTYLHLSVLQVSTMESTERKWVVVIALINHWYVSNIAVRADSYRF